MKSALGVLIIVLCIGVGWFVYQLTEEAARDIPDPVTFCPRVITSHTVLMIDQTDELSERTLLGLQHVIERVGLLVNEGGRLTIFRIEENSDKTMTALYDACRPINAGELQSNLIVQKRRQDDFSSAMKGLATTTTNAKESEYSPIIEMVNNVVAEIVAPQDRNKARIVLFSDMLQNSPRCTDYPRKRKAVGAECPATPQMSGMKVDIHYIIRPAYADIQGQVHKEKWTSRFSQAGAAWTLVEEY